MYCMIYIPREPGSLVMGILTPKPTSMTTEEIQRTSMYFLPCRKKSMSQHLTFLLNSVLYDSLNQKAADKIANTAIPTPVSASLGTYPVLPISSGNSTMECHLQQPVSIFISHRHLDICSGFGKVTMYRDGKSVWGSYHAWIR